MKVRLLAAILFGLFSTISTIGMAHGAHCHLRGPDGRLTDESGATTPAACAKEHGIWLHHHAHCHVKNKAGKSIDAAGVKDQAQCSSKGGQWLDHTHDGLEHL